MTKYPTRTKNRIESNLGFLQDNPLTENVIESTALNSLKEIVPKWMWK